MQHVTCEGCGRPTPDYDSVHYGSMEQGYRRLCNQCFNAEIAQRAGLVGFEHLSFKPVVLSDCTGDPHTFHFRIHLLGDRVALDAFELINESPGGYRFEVVGAAEEDLLVLLGRLIEKMRRGLAVKHLQKHEGVGWQIADHLTVRGVVDCDLAQESRLPLLVIDGREVSWEAFGHILMSFEGWQFKLEFFDRSEEP